MTNLREIANTIAQRLIESHTTIATAESCTGGLITYSLSQTPGISEVLLGGFVTYSNQLKENVLNVPASTLSEHGAVSKEVVEAMLKGTQAITQTDICLAVSGIAGPDGGTEEKPVGTVWVGLKSGEQPPKTEHHLFEGNRTEVQEQATIATFKLLISSLNMSS